MYSRDGDTARLRSRHACGKHDRRAHGSGGSQPGYRARRKDSPSVANHPYLRLYDAKGAVRLRHPESRFLKTARMTRVRRVCEYFAVRHLEFYVSWMLFILVSVVVTAIVQIAVHNAICR